MYTFENNSILHQIINFALFTYSINREGCYSDGATLSVLTVLMVTSGVTWTKDYFVSLRKGLSSTELYQHTDAYLCPHF